MMTRAQVALRRAVREHGLPLVLSVAGCHRTTFWRWVTGETKADLDVAARLERHFGIHAVDWYDEAGEVLCTDATGAEG